LTLFLNSFRLIRAECIRPRCIVKNRVRPADSESERESEYVIFHDDKTHIGEFLVVDKERCTKYRRQCAYHRGRGCNAD